MATQTYGVTGLTCEHCVNAVQEEVGELAGVSSASVDLVKDGESTLRVESDSPIDFAALEAAVKEAGEDYRITAR